MVRELLFLDPVLQLSDSVRTALRQHRITTVVLHDVHAAQEELAQNTPQLVLVDFLMPRLVSFLQECRSLAADVPVMLMCEPGHVRQAVATMSYGVADYVLKPLHIDELMTKASRLMDLHDFKESSSPMETVQEEFVDVRLFKAVQRFEYDYVSRALNRFQGDKKRAAKHLGISLSSLYRKLDYGASVS